MDEDGHLVTDRKYHTNVPGVFAAGEIQDKVFKQVATSVGQGCGAAMSATRFLEELEAGHVLVLGEDPREGVRGCLGSAVSLAPSTVKRARRTWLLRCSFLHRLYLLSNQAPDGFGAARRLALF